MSKTKEESTTTVEISTVVASREEKMPISAILAQVGLTCGLSFLLVSCSSAYGITGISLPSISSDLKMTQTQTSFYASSIYIGSLLGIFICSPLSIKYGQKTTLIIATPLVVIGWCISYFAEAFWLHVLSRIILGLFVYIAVPCSFTYVTEIAHHKIRGKLLAILSLAKQLGFLFVYLIGSTDLNWRLLGFVCGLSPLVVSITVSLIFPHSPRWLALKRRPESEILKTLKVFRGHCYDVKSEYNSIQDDTEHNSARNGSSTIWNQFRFLREKSNYKKLILLGVLNFTVNFTGDATILGYSVSIFKSTNSSISPYISTIICGVVRIIGSLLYMCLADCTGRKVQLMVFLGLSSLCTGSLGIYFYFDSAKYDMSPVFWLPLTCLILFTLFNCLFYPVIELIKNEILPNSVRLLGINILNLIMGLTIFLVVSTYPLIVKNFGAHWAFFLYTANNIFMVLFIYFNFPETKGKTLEEIAQLS